MLAPALNRRDLVLLFEKSGMSKILPKRKLERQSDTYRFGRATLIDKTTVSLEQINTFRSNILNSKKLGSITCFAPDSTSIYLASSEEKIIALSDLKIEFQKNLVPMSNDETVGPSCVEINDRYLDEYLIATLPIPIILTAALESYLNQKLAEMNYGEYTKGKYRDAYSIQRNFSLENKIKLLAKRQYKQLSKEMFYTTILELIDLRNDLVHLKFVKKDYKEKLVATYVRVIDCDFQIYLKSIRNLMAYFGEPNFAKLSP